MDQNPEPVGVNKSTSSQQFSDSPSDPVREFAETGPAHSTELTPIAQLSSIESNVGGREQHNRWPPTRFNDYMCYSAHAIDPVLHANSSKKGSLGTRYPFSKLCHMYKFFS